MLTKQIFHIFQTQETSSGKWDAAVDQERQIVAHAPKWQLSLSECSLLSKWVQMKPHSPSEHSAQVSHDPFRIHNFHMKTLPSSLGRSWEISMMSSEREGVVLNPT